MLNHSAIRDYFLSFDDPVSFDICKIFKREPLGEEQVRKIVVSNNDQLCGVLFDLKSEQVLVIADVQNNLFYKKYFVEPIDWFDITHHNGVFQLLVKSPLLDSIHLFKLEKAEFVKVEPKPAAINSITQYMRQNSSLPDNAPVPISSTSAPIHSLREGF